jgi:PST family polysaccharide transporter
MKIERATAARSLWWVVLESGGLQLLSFLAVIVLARFLTPVEFGVAALALGIVQLLGMIVSALFHDAIIQRKELEPLHVDSAFWAATLLGFLLCLACWLSGDLVASLLGEKQTGSVLGWMSLRLLFSGVDAATAAEMRRSMQFKALATRSLSGRLAGAIAGIVGAALGYGVWALVAQQIMMAGLASVVLLVKAPRRPSLRLSLGALGDLVTFGFASLVNTVLGAGSLRIMTLLVGSMLGAAGLGYISAAFRFVDALKDALAPAANQLAMPVLSRRQGDHQALRRAYRQALEFTCAVSLPIFAGLIPCAADLITVVLGPRWLPATPIVQVLAGVSIVMFIRLFNATMLNAVGRPMLNAVLGSVGLVIAVISVVIVARYGMVAAVAGWFVPRILLTMPLSFSLQRRTTGMSAREQLQGAVAPAASATVMALAVFMLGQVEPIAAWSSAARLAFLVPTGALVYFVALLICGRGTIQRLIIFLTDGLRGTRGRAPAPSAPSP